MDCDFVNFTNEPCNRLIYNRKAEILDFTQLDEEKKETLLWRAGGQQAQTICLHHKYYFGKAFELRHHSIKCRDNFKIHYNAFYKG